MLDGQEKKKCSRGGAQSLLKRVRHAFGKILGVGMFVPIMSPGFGATVCNNIQGFPSDQLPFTCFYKSPFICYEYCLLVSSYLFLLPYILRSNVLVKL